MKLWEIKAQSLRIMFADTDVQFSETEFSNGSLMNNANTREKLIRMNDSIKRAIDLYYQYNGQITRKTELGLKSETILDVTTYTNSIDLSGISDFDSVERVDVIKNLDAGIIGYYNIGFEYDLIDEEIVFPYEDWAYYEGDISFNIYYKMKPSNFVEPVDEMTYDLDTLYIPSDIQRMIPYFVKGELYEEDEYAIAIQAKQEYIQFLISNQRKYTSKKQKKVRARYPRGLM